MADKPITLLADNYSVVVPYKDFVDLLDAASKSGLYEIRIKRLEDQLGALNGLYSQVLEKVGELNRLVID